MGKLARCLEKAVDDDGKEVEDDTDGNHDIEGASHTLMLLLEKKERNGKIDEDGAEDEHHDAIVGRHDEALLE